MNIGVDLGGSHIAVGIVNDNGKIIAKKEIDTYIVNLKKEEVENYIRDNIIMLIHDVLNQVGAPMCLIEKIGIGSPGTVRNNIIKKCNKFGIENFDLVKLLKDYYQVDVYVKNDAKCAALAEYKYGNLKDVKDAVFLCIGTGIGGATFINGEMLVPKRADGSEFGHMIIKKDGKQCNCGNKGCYETYASMKEFKTGLIELLNLNVDTTANQLLEILNNSKENEKVNAYIDEYIDNLTLGIANIVNIIQPQVICLGGGFTYFEEILYKRLLENIQLEKYKFMIPQIILGKLKNDAGIIGATLIYDN